MDLAHVPLAEVTRGECVESIHYGAVAVVDAQGTLLFSAGDPHFLTFTRSTLKPFQAYPFLRDGGADRFTLTSQEIALMCASHSGEPMHIDVVRSILRKAGCEEHHLQCGCHVPAFYSATDAPVPAGMVFDQLFNNCSGKHAGFLACCMMHGYPVDTYLEMSHPLQRAIGIAVSDMACVAERDLRAGIDGCSAPNYAMPLSSLALAYARLAIGADAALARLCGAMTAHPELVSGTARGDLKLAQLGQGDWVVKAGAEGVQAVGIRSLGLGVAIKVADGDARPMAAIVLSVLKQLGVLDEGGRTAGFEAEPRIENLRGVPTGVVRPCVRLRAA